MEATCPQEPNQRKNALRRLIEDHQQYALVSQLLERGLISMEQVSIILWDIVQANIITLESLRYTPLDYLGLALESKQSKAEQFSQVYQNHLEARKTENNFTPFSSVYWPRN